MKDTILTRIVKLILWHGMFTKNTPSFEDKTYEITTIQQSRERIKLNIKADPTSRFLLSSDQFKLLTSIFGSDGFSFSVQGYSANEIIIRIGFKYFFPKHWEEKQQNFKRDLRKLLTKGPKELEKL